MKAPGGAAVRSGGMRRAVGEDEKAQRRQAILAAAKKVFARHGFHGTTMAEVARAAHLSYGSVYWYFDSKDSLFHALMDEEGQALRAAILDAVAADGTAADVATLLRLAVRTTFEFFEADRATVKLLFRDSYALGTRFEKHLYGVYEGFIDDLEALVAAGRQQGALADLPPRPVAFSIAALVSQLALRRLTTDDGLPADQVADFVTAMLFDGLRPR